MEWNSQIICILKHDLCLNWALMWCQRILNKAFTNSIFNWEENKCSLLLMITDAIFFTKLKTSANIQQQRWFQSSSILLQKNKEMIEKLIINTE